MYLNERVGALNFYVDKLALKLVKSLIEIFLKLIYLVTRNYNYYNIK